MKYGGACRCLAQSKSGLVGPGQYNVSDRHVFNFAGGR